MIVTMVRKRAMARALLHPNVWLPVVAVGTALWAYVLGVYSFRDGQPAQEMRPDILIVSLLMIAALAAIQLMFYYYARGRIGLVTVVLIPVFLTVLRHMDEIWRARFPGLPRTDWPSTGLFLLGDVACSILLYLAYSRSAPSAFSLVASTQPHGEIPELI
jgi:hypothetical protein